MTAIPCVAATGQAQPGDLRVFEKSRSALGCRKLRPNVRAWWTPPEMQEDSERAWHVVRCFRVSGL